MKFLLRRIFPGVFWISVSSFLRISGLILKVEMYSLSGIISKLRVASSR